MREVLPCPFCGSCVLHIEVDHESGFVAFECFRCGCSGPGVHIDGHGQDGQDSEEIAAMLWNERMGL